MIVQPESTPGKTGRERTSISPGEGERTAIDPSLADRFCKAPGGVVFDESLTASERLLLIALRFFDWGNGEGGRPSNATLIKGTGLRSDGPDKGAKALRKLLKGLKDKGRIRVEVFKPSGENPTGRVIYLLPTPGSTGPESGRPPRVYRPDPPGSTDPPPPGLQTLQIDSGIDPGTDPSSDDDDLAPLPGGENAKAHDAEKRLGDQARRTFPNKPRADRVVTAIPGWLAWVGAKMPDQAEAIISAAIAGATGARPGGEVGYIRQSIANRLAKGEPQSAATSAPPLVAPVIARRKAEGRVAERQDAELRGRWFALSDGEREAIEADVKATNPVTRKFPKFLESFCIAEMDRRHPPEPWMSPA